jgi:hypothetical protein
MIVRVRSQSSLPGGSQPFPEPGEDERRTVLHPDRERLFQGAGMLPLIEAIGRNQTTAFIPQREEKYQRN